MKIITTILTGLLALTLFTNTYGILRNPPVIIHNNSDHDLTVEFYKPAHGKWIRGASGEIEIGQPIYIGRGENLEFHITQTKYNGTLHHGEGRFVAYYHTSNKAEECKVRVRVFVNDSARKISHEFIDGAAPDCRSKHWSGDLSRSVFGVDKKIIRFNLYYK